LKRRSAQRTIVFLVHRGGFVETEVLLSSSCEGFVETREKRRTRSLIEPSHYGALYQFCLRHDCGRQPANWLLPTRARARDACCRGDVKPQSFTDAIPGTSSQRILSISHDDGSCNAFFVTNKLQEAGGQLYHRRRRALAAASTLHDASYEHVAARQRGSPRIGTRREIAKISARPFDCDAPYHQQVVWNRPATGSVCASLL
jgi:hypothetical protein